MKLIKATLTLEFETDDTDKEVLSETIKYKLEEIVENDEVMESMKIKITDLDDEDLEEEED